MHYVMTITADHDMSEDERLTALDPLGDTYDSASMGVRKIVVTGSAHPAYVAVARAWLRDMGYQAWSRPQRDDDPVESD